jgi:hypothetical protein
MNEFDKESFAEWHARVGHRIPQVPSNVAEHWIHRHWGHSPYEFLPLARLRFESQTWTLEKLRAVQFGWDSRSSASDLTRLDQPMIRNTPLARLMLAAGTWPEPIIVLDNDDGLLDDWRKPMRRWHLLEGHLRLTYLRCLEHKGQARPRHDLWLARLVPSRRRQ